MAKIILAALVTLTSFSAFAGTPSAPEAIRGFHSADGHVLIEMSSKSFTSGNVFFLGDSKKLNQLELTWDDSNAEERVLTYVVTDGGESSEITLSPAGATVQNGVRPGHLHVDQMTAMTASELKAVSKASLRMLPEIWGSKYLFQSAVTGEYLLVKEPVFNFHGNYRVWLGDLGNLKELMVKNAENWKEGVAGDIKFESGGGLFIPKMSEILSTLKPTQAEMPTLVRPNSSSFEVLKVPKLTPTQLARLGFLKNKVTFSRPGVDPHILTAKRYRVS